MAKVIEKSAKTVEDALKAAIQELGVNENEVDYEIVEKASRGIFGFGAKPAKIRVTIKENIKSDIETKPLDTSKKDYDNGISKKIEDIPVETQDKISDNIVDSRIEIAKKFLQDVFYNMKLDVKIEAVPWEEGYILNLRGENLGILIGKHGQTLDALQYLVNLAANRNENQRVRFVVDVENYRSRRAETLQNLAVNLADRAVRMNQDVKLEPMNRHERKVIHTALQNNDKITTHSTGEEPYRYIIISPKKYSKPKINSNRK